MDNTGRDELAVELVGGRQQAVYAEVERLAPHTSLALQAVLPPGRYSWQCEDFDGTVTHSAAATVHGPKVTDAHPFVQVTQSQLISSTLAYRASVAAGLAQLSTEVDQLTAAVDAGNVGQAEALWLTAHMQYERLGAAYDTFGDLGDEIDGLPNGLPGGVNDPKFTGFFRLEYGLWHGQPAGTLAAVAGTLDQDVHSLVAQFPTLQTDPNNVALRTHEILENTLQFELTGESDQGSHTNLATARANVDGTEMALAAVTPLLRLYDPTVLKQATSGLAGLATLLQGYQQPGGGWTPVQSLTTTQREQLDSAVSGLLEQLDTIPDVLELAPTPASDND